MGIGSPGFLHVAMAEASGDFLDIYSLVDQHGCMRMTEFMDGDMREMCDICVLAISIVDCRVSKGFFSAADIQGIVETSVLGQP